MNANGFEVTAPSRPSRFSIEGADELHACSRRRLDADFLFASICGYLFSKKKEILFESSNFGLKVIHKKHRPNETWL